MVLFSGSGVLANRQDGTGRRGGWRIVSWCSIPNYLCMGWGSGAGVSSITVCSLGVVVITKASSKCNGLHIYYISNSSDGASSAVGWSLHVSTGNVDDVIVRRRRTGVAEGRPGLALLSCSAPDATINFSTVMFCRGSVAATARLAQGLEANGTQAVNDTVCSWTRCGRCLRGGGAQHFGMGGREAACFGNLRRAGRSQRTKGPLFENSEARYGPPLRMPVKPW